MTDLFEILIVGAGHGGAQASIALRQRGFAGTIAIVGEEPELPYERPPLSKEYLAGDKTFERILIRPEAFWAEREVTMLLGRRVASVDPIAHRVTLEEGVNLNYHHLIWATGGSPRRLTCSGQDLVGVHGVRNRADVERMIREMPGTDEVVVIGGGYIGLEAAAVLTKLGKRVTGPSRPIHRMHLFKRSICQNMPYTALNIWGVITYRLRVAWTLHRRLQVAVNAQTVGFEGIYQLF